MKDDHKENELTQETSKEISSMVRNLIEHLVAGRYEKLYLSSPNSPDPEQDFKEAIGYYSEVTGLEISTPPPEAYSMGFYVNSFIRKGKTVALISFPLWFGGQPSELHVEIDLEKKEDGRWVSALTDILVP